MSIRFEDIRAFQAVVESGSVSAAARRLGVAKSVFSKRVTGLERALGGTLLKRSPRRVQATDRGRAFYERSRAILASLDDAAAAVREGGDELRGSIGIAAPLTFGTMHLGDLLWPFLHRHPRLEVAVDLDDRVVDLLGSGYDLGIRIGTLPDSSLVGRKLADMARVLCASPAYLARAGTPASLAELPQHESIGYAHLATGQVWPFQRARAAGATRVVRVRSRIVANNREFMRGAAIAGLGLLMLPEFIVARELRDGALVRVLPNCRPLRMALYALYPRERHQSPRVRLLVDQLAAALKLHPPWEAR